MQCQHKQSWKGLTLLSHGGSPHRFQTYMNERAASRDEHARSLAKVLLALFSCIEKRYTVIPSLKKMSAAKAEA